jgi:hypothetical protein
LLLFTAQGALACGSHSIKLVPAYRGSVSSWVQSGVSGCSQEGKPVPISFDLTTGIAGSAGWARSNACPPGNASGSSAFVRTGENVSIDLPAHLNGYHSIHLNAYASFTLRLVINDSGSCPTTLTLFAWGNRTSGSCDVFAEANLFTLWSVRDLSNGSIINESNPEVTPPTYQPIVIEANISIDWGCYVPSYGGGCFSHNASNLSGPAMLAISTGLYYGGAHCINGTFSTHHRYVLFGFAYTDWSTAVNGWTSASANARLNVGNGGQGFLLSSIVVR